MRYTTFIIIILQEWEKFLDILMTEKSCNGEYDILLLPANGWDRYNDQQTK